MTNNIMHRQMRMGALDPDISDAPYNSGAGTLPTASSKSQDALM
jgi:hypothetical protein